MNDHCFFLQPSSPVGPPPNRKMTGNITRDASILAIRYVVLDKPTPLVIPQPADLPTRKNHLWEETCFEFFLAVNNSPRYWEFNLSPAGRWNVYCLEG